MPLERGTLRVAVDLADVRPGERLLDVGTGTGALLREVARRGAGPALVIGVDRSPRMLSEVGGLPESRRIVVADARALPFADATFDVITLVFLLHLLRSEDRAHVLDATRRALRPAGRVVSVMVESRHPALRWGLGLLPAWTGLRRLDPRADMRTAGLRPERARHTERW